MELSSNATSKSNTIYNFINSNNNKSNDTDLVNCESTAVINVRGVKFETYWLNLKKLPELEESIRNHGLVRYTPNKEYFLDRDPDVFKCLLNYCSLGELHIPVSICGPVFSLELKMWGLHSSHINKVEYCCYKEISSSISRLKNLQDFYHTFYDHPKLIQSSVDERHSSDWLDDDDKLINEKQTCRRRTYQMWRIVSRNWRKLRPKVWSVLDQPMTSRLAFAYAVFICIIVILNFFVFCTDTVDSPRFRTNITEPNIEIVSLPPDQILNSSLANSTGPINRTNAHTQQKRTPIMNFMFLFTNFLLTIDIFARIIFCPKFITFMSNPYTVIDILSLIPFWCQLVTSILNNQKSMTIIVITNSGKLLRLLSLSIGLRFFRVLRHYCGLQVLLYTMKRSGYVLLLIKVIISVVIIIFSSLIYFAESESNGAVFQTIPHSFWWCIVTLTTVGYGDMVPKSLLGKAVASACSLVGLLVIAIIVSVLVENFMMYYNFACNQIQYGFKDAVVQMKGLLKSNDENGHRETDGTYVEMEKEGRKDYSRPSSSQLSIHKFKLSPKKSPLPYPRSKHSSPITIRDPHNKYADLLPGDIHYKINPLYAADIKDIPIAKRNTNIKLS